MSFQEGKVILERLEVGPIAANCYIVGDEASKEGIIIDPGDEPDTILRKVEELDLTINLIVLTHAHNDHIGALVAVKEATSAQAALHPDDITILQARVRFDARSVIDRFLNGGDSIDIGDTHLLVIHTPGHSPGGVCLLGDGILFSGDTLFNFGIGRFDLAGGSGRQLMDSIYTKLMVLPDDTVVYPGHGPGTTIGEERRGNPFLRG
jgi:glyoxylase-like metal-dependent hydrolase (beta-lactamase superfamily II)